MQSADKSSHQFKLETERLDELSWSRMLAASWLQSTIV